MGIAKKKVILRRLQKTVLKQDAAKSKKKAELVRNLRESLRKLQETMDIINYLKCQENKIRESHQSSPSLDHRPVVHRFMLRLSMVTGMIYTIMAEAADIRERINRMYGYSDPRIEEDL